MRALVMLVALSSVPAAAEPEGPSETTATSLALGATGLGALAFYEGTAHNTGALAGPGLVLVLVGPAAGHIYAGETNHAVLTSAGRLWSLIVMAVGAASFVEVGCLNTACTPASGSGRNVGWGLIVGGGLAYTGLTIYDFVDAHRAAHRQQRRSTVVPTVAPGSVGLSLAGRF